jgi:hypothetical protein
MAVHKTSSNDYHRMRCAALLSVVRTQFSLAFCICPLFLCSWLPHHRPGTPPSAAHIAAAAVALLAAIACCIYGIRTFHTHLLVQNALDTPIIEPPSNLMLNVQQHAADEMLLRQLVDECVKQQQSVIHLDSQRRMVTSSSINPQ